MVVILILWCRLSSKMKKIILLLFVFIMGGCGSSETESEGGLNFTCANCDNNENSDQVNTEKLIGTPFEGMETGDDFSWELFQCLQYQTNSIDEIPIKIFTAFFTDNEEQVISEGVNIANEAVGYTLYELTDAWNDTYRVIYYVQKIEDNGFEPSATGKTLSLEASMEGYTYASTQAVDWTVELESNGIDKWTVAHELGHASGITAHALIDYENDTITELEVGSLMEPDGGNSKLTDYTYMMQKQGELIQNHLGVLGAVESSISLCDEFE